MKNIIFKFQGCHICGNLVNFQVNGNPENETDARFLISMARKVKFQKNFFRVPKKCSSGLPYLRRLSLEFGDMHLIL